MADRGSEQSWNGPPHTLKLTITNCIAEWSDGSDCITNQLGLCAFRMSVQHRVANKTNKNVVINSATSAFALECNIPSSDRLSAICSPHSTKYISRMPPDRALNTGWVMKLLTNRSSSSYSSPNPSNFKESVLILLLVFASSFSLFLSLFLSISLFLLHSRSEEEESVL